MNSMNSMNSMISVETRCAGRGKEGHTVYEPVRAGIMEPRQMYQLCEDEYGRIFQNTIARYCFPINCEIFFAHFSIPVDTRAYIENRNKKTILKNSTFLSILKDPLVSTAI